MRVTIFPSSIKGTIAAIPSKSFAHRQLICAALSKDSTEILCRVISEDVKTTMNCLETLGADIKYKENTIFVNGIKSLPKKALLDCGESGSTYRFMVPLAAALGVEANFLLKGRLAERPMTTLWNTLEDHGIKIDGKGSRQTILNGSLSSGLFKIEGNVSSQFISGLLMSLPFTAGENIVDVMGEIESESYIKITLEVLEDFGIDIKREEGRFIIRDKQSYISPGSIVTEGDWSNSSFWFCGAAASGTELTCLGLNSASSQGDRRVIDILTKMGCIIEEKEGAFTLRPHKLNAASVDAMDIPDLIPALALAACSAEGSSEIFNAHRLRMKESDRLFSISDTLSRLGADIYIEANSMHINGKKRLTGGVVHSHGDHRIVMMAAMSSLISSNAVVIEGAEAVNKSYPGFFEDLASLGVEIRKE